MATISFSANFNLALSTKQFQFTDTSNYAGQGINYGYITGSFKITAPSGNVIYDNLVNYQAGNLADINGDNYPAAFPTNQTTIQFNYPNETGVYTVYYKVWDSDAELTYEVTETFNYQYVSPVVSISGSVQVYTPSPLLTLTDNTLYIVNSITPTIGRVATITYPDVLVNNVLTVPTPTVGSTATTTSTTFYTPTQVTMSVITNLSYTITSNFTVTDLVSGLIYFDIDATSFCKLWCGLNTLRMYCDSNPSDAEAQDRFAYLMGLVTLVMLAQNCGKTDAISIIIAEIEAIGNFTEDCSCGDGVQQVIGLGSIISAYDVLGANSYITVTPETSGNTTTFTIQLSPSFIATVGENTDNIDTLLADVALLQNQMSIALADRTLIGSYTGSIDVTLFGYVTGFLLQNIGNSYHVGDTLSFSGGTFVGTAPTLTVLTINGSGGILTFSTAGSGYYSVKPSNPVVLTGGFGNSATVNLYYDNQYNLEILNKVKGGANSSVTLGTGTSQTKALASDLTIPADGLYKITFDADITGDTDIIYNYYPIKNGNLVDSISVNGTSDVKSYVRVGVSGTTVNKTSLTMYAQLVASDVVNVVFRSSGSATSSLINRFLLFEKVSN